MKHWYLVQTKLRQEFIARDNLQRQGFRVFMPTLPRTSRKQNRWITQAEPLFPGYLFIHINQYQQNIAPVRSTIGVLKLVRFGTELQIVPDAIVADIQQRVANSESHPVALPLKQGDSVRITSGSFKGMTAIFAAESGMERVELLLDLLGRYNKISINRDQIDPVKNS